MQRDYAIERSIVTEPDIDRFVKSVGGARLDERLENPNFDNADYVFNDQRVIIELKILETEFGETESFRKKDENISREMVRRFGINAVWRRERAAGEFLFQRRLDLYRAPLARIAKKANKQIRSTRGNMELEDHRGILLLVNDGFRGIASDLVVAIMSRVLNGSNSEIHGFVYLTNHYVAVPGSNYAHLLWIPVYAVGSEGLSDFVNWLGSEWFGFVEAETGPFETSLKTPDYEHIRGARPIR